MKDKFFIKRAIANRVAPLVDAADSELSNINQVRIPNFILKALKESLLSGETHYTARPGMPELRKRILKEISLMGGPKYDSINNVLITTGESESLFVTLLGLKLFKGDFVIADDHIRHRKLFRLFDLRPNKALQPLIPTKNTLFIYRERENSHTVQEELIQLSVALDLPDFLSLGDSLASDHHMKIPPASIKHTLLSGTFHALPGISFFQLGYLLGPEVLISRIRVWKQAFSICSAAPSQRAALTALYYWQEKVG
jgi:hypothetical protein